MTDAHKFDAATEAEFKRREERIEAFLEKVQDLQEEYSDSVSALVVSVLSIQEEGQARTYGGWSVPPHQSNRAYNELSDLLMQETEDLVENIRHLDGTGERKNIQYDA